MRCPRVVNYNEGENLGEDWREVPGGGKIIVRHVLSVSRREQRCAWRGCRQSLSTEEAQISIL